MNLWAYATKGTIQWGKCPDIQTHFVNGSHEVSQSISTPTPQNYHLLHFWEGVAFTVCKYAVIALPVTWSQCQLASTYVFVVTCFPLVLGYHVEFLP